MRYDNILLIAVSLGVIACNREPAAPTPAIEVTGDAPIVSAANGAVRFTYRIDVPIDWLLTPTDFPCLTEPIHVFGSFEEHLNFVDSPGSIHLTVHQSTNSVQAVGLTSGDTYQFSGPLTFTASGSTDQEEPLEFTFHNINHIVGPGRDADIYFRTLVHVTREASTGEPIVEVIKDEVLCH